ncbi:hypothetical protein KJ966_21940 [bacterium]|nr:hypothetical protein [bacterium]
MERASIDAYYFKYFDKDLESKFKKLMYGGEKGKGVIAIEKDGTRKWFERKSFPVEYRTHVAVWMLMSEFYQDFFDLALTNREHLFNSQRLSLQKHLLMKLSLWPEDHFWISFLDLHEIKKLSDKPVSEEKLAEHKADLYLRFNIQFNGMDGLLSEQLSAWEDFQLILNNRFKDFTDSHSKLLKIALELKMDDVADLLDKRWKMISGIYLIILMLSRVSIERKFGEVIGSTHQCLLKNAITLVELLHNIEHESFHPFKKDLRMLYLQTHGDRYLYEQGGFKVLNEESRKQILISGREFLENTKPGITDSMQYSFWYRYYSYLHHQREMQHDMINRHYISTKNGLIDLMDELNELENATKGGHLTLYLKIKYHQRSVSFLLHSLEASLISQEIGQLNEANVMNKDSTFENDWIWWKEVRPNNNF